MTAHTHRIQVPEHGNDVAHLHATHQHYHRWPSKNASYAKAILLGLLALVVGVGWLVMVHFGG